MSRTRRPWRAMPAARLTVVVVLPTPPFWFMSAMTRTGLPPCMSMAMDMHGGRPVRVIALMNQKGGVGKTTTTVNLAAGIARQGRRVLLIDLDPQAHATLHLGVQPEPTAGSVYDLLLDPTTDAVS